ncbi:4227_t:CDS:2, partial [Gigaspora rosea]
KEEGTGTELSEYKSRLCKKQECETAQKIHESESEIGNTNIEELLSKHFDLYVRDSMKNRGFFKQIQSYLMFLMLKKEKRGIGDENAGYGDVNGDKADMNSDKDEYCWSPTTAVNPSFFCKYGSLGCPKVPRSDRFTGCFSILGAQTTESYPSGHWIVV